jgi:hypothetical protein
MRFRALGVVPKVHPQPNQWSDAMHNDPSLTRHEARAHALRREAMVDFWRGADAVWARLQLDAAARLARSTLRLQARLRHRAGASATQAAPGAAEGMGARR